MNVFFIIFFMVFHAAHGVEATLSPRIDRASLAFMPRIDLPLQVIRQNNRCLLGSGFSSPTNTILQVRGGAMDDWVTPEKLTGLFAGLGLFNGILFTFATDLAMKLFHNYHDCASTEDGKAASRAAASAGASMLGYGLLSYLTAVRGMETEPAMAWSLLPMFLHLALPFNTNKSVKAQRPAGIVAAALLISAVSLTLGDRFPLSKDAAALITLGTMGIVASLCIVLPVTMIHKLETAPKNKKGIMEENPSYRMKFVTQATGTHTMVYLALYLALWKGADAHQAVGYAALTTALLSLSVCGVGPNMRKSGAPMGPMIPLTTLFSYMAWKLGALPL